MFLSVTANMWVWQGTYLAKEVCLPRKYLGKILNLALQIARFLRARTKLYTHHDPIFMLPSQHDNNTLIDANWLSIRSRSFFHHCARASQALKSLNYPTNSSTQLPQQFSNTKLLDIFHFSNSRYTNFPLDERSFRRRRRRRLLSSPNPFLLQRSSNRPRKLLPRSLFLPKFPSIFGSEVPSEILSPCQADTRGRCLSLYSHTFSPFSTIFFAIFTWLRAPCSRSLTNLDTYRHRDIQGDFSNLGFKSSHSRHRHSFLSTARISRNQSFFHEFD